MRWIVYETRCLVSGKIYVGVHRQDEDGFDGYLGSGKALKRAIKKHGVENFVRRTLEEFSVEAEAYAREAEIVTEEFFKRRDTYNVKPGGIGGSGMCGKTHTPESREKLREANLGKAHTPETREKLRKAALGRKHTPETREKLREANLRRCASHRNKTLTPETREKLRKAALGRKHTPEAREKIREANLRRWANHRNNAL